MFKTDTTNYHKIGGNRFLFNAGLDDGTDRTRRTPNAWSGSPIGGLPSEPVIAASPSVNTSVMDTSLRVGDLQSPSGNTTGRNLILSPGIGLAKNATNTATGGRVGDSSSGGDATSGAYGAGGLPGAFGMGTAAHHDRIASNNDEEDCYLPTYLLGVNATTPKEQYAAPLEPENSRAFHDNGGAIMPGKLFPPFADYRAPLNAYDADDDAPPQTSLLDLTNDNQATSSAYMPLRQQNMSNNMSFGGSILERNDNVRDLSTRDLTESMVFGASTSSNVNTTRNMIDDPMEAEARNETPMSVTVFGFPPSAASTILARFRDLGDVIGFKPPTQGANHFTITYRTRLHAQRALSLNGTLVEDWMIGVMEVPLDNNVDLQRSTMNKSIRDAAASNNNSNSAGENLLRVQKARLQEAPLLTSPVSASGTLTSSVRTSGTGDNLYHNLLDMIFQW
ncbi:hypothetical protein BDF22DRAFT_662182 [Syncephalis plumigaleata]|nr:hypothetical protein BDF22DRAFT_662182 [Syncephalis plumigaleata]